MTGESAAAAAAAAAGQAPVAVVTGANTGIGFHVAGQLAEKGYDVVLACRSEEKAQAAVERMRELYPAGRSPKVRALDLSSLASVSCFAAGLSAACKKLDLLVCNAGLNSKSVSKARAAAWRLVLFSIREESGSQSHLRGLFFFI